MHPMIERRGSPRVNFSGVTLLHAGKTEIPCVAHDLSESGILVFPQQQSSIGPGQTLRVAFNLPPTTGWVDLHGKVVRQATVEKQPVLGLHFEHLPYSVQARLRKFVRGYQPRPRLLSPRQIDREFVRSLLSDDDGDDTGVMTRDELSHLLVPDLESADHARPTVEPDTKVIEEEDLFVLKVTCRKPPEQS